MQNSFETDQDGSDKARKKLNRPLTEEERKLLSSQTVSSITSKLYEISKEIRKLTGPDKSYVQGILDSVSRNIYPWKNFVNNNVIVSSVRPVEKFSRKSERVSSTRGKPKKGKGPSKQAPKVRDPREQKAREELKSTLVSIRKLKETSTEQLPDDHELIVSKNKALKEIRSFKKADDSIPRSPSRPDSSKSEASRKEAKKSKSEKPKNRKRSFGKKSLKISKDSPIANRTRSAVLETVSQGADPESGMGQ